MKNKLVDKGTIHRKYPAQSEPAWAASSSLGTIQLITFPGESLGSSCLTPSVQQSPQALVVGLLASPKPPFPLLPPPCCTFLRWIQEFRSVKHGGLNGPGVGP